MKAWEKHLVDLFLLINDIQENMSYQRLGYKTQFYYKFNYQLKFIQSDGSYSAQLKLLHQIQDEGAISFEVKKPGKYINEHFFSRSIGTNWSKDKKFIRIKIHMKKFNEVYKGLKKYTPQAPYQEDENFVLRIQKSDTKLILKINNKQYLIKEFRPGFPPDQIFEQLVNRWPNTKITRTKLDVEAHIKTSRQLNHIVDKSIPPKLRKLLFPAKDRDNLQIKTELLVNRNTVNEILAELN